MTATKKVLQSQFYCARKDAVWIHRDYGVEFHAEAQLLAAVADVQWRRKEAQRRRRRSA